MGIEEFEDLYSDYLENDPVELQCATCGRTKTYLKRSAAKNLRLNGEFRCKGCKIGEHYHTHPGKLSRWIFGERYQ